MSKQLGYSKEQQTGRRDPTKFPKASRRKCAICKTKYTCHPTEIKRKWCDNPDCKYSYLAKLGLKKAEKNRQLLIKAKKTEWNNKKDRWKKELGIKKIKSDPLQKTVNKIVSLIDEGKPCLARPTHSNLRMEAGHVYPRSSHPGLKYNFWNIHNQGNYSNSSQKDDADMRHGLVVRYGEERLNYLKELNKHLEKNPLKLSEYEYKEALGRANKILREWKSNPITNRDTLNDIIGLY